MDAVKIYFYYLLVRPTDASKILNRKTIKKYTQLLLNKCI